MNAISHAQRCRAYRLRVRNKVLAAYGNKCACCAEARREFLAIDHINGGGTKQRRSPGFSTPTQLANDLIRRGFPEGFRILCHNCNLAMGFYGYCPHEKERADAHP